MITRRAFSTILAGSTVMAALPGFASGKSSLERVKASGVLRIGAVADGAPYYQKSIADGSWRGFYIDICKNLAADLGVELEIKETTWGNSVLDLQADQAGCVLWSEPDARTRESHRIFGALFQECILADCGS